MTDPYYQDANVTLWHGDCLDVLPTLPDASVDAVVTDPPYGLGFMGKEWDSGKSFVERKPEKRNTFDHVGGNHNPTNSIDAARTRRVESGKFGDWCELWAVECLRVLKPGGHLLAFGGTRTSHRLACAIEDAGFEIRDSIAWMYGSGFPKSLNVSKQIDGLTMTGKGGSSAWRHANENRPGDAWTRENTNNRTGQWVGDKENTGPSEKRDTPATDNARIWQGWGTALKPAHEPIVVARKPLAGTVAANVLTHGTGALNIDGCRVGDDERLSPPMGNPEASYGGYAASASVVRGRWPANVVLDESQAEALDQQSGITSETARTLHRNGARQMDGWGLDAVSKGAVHGDTGGASRFFYVAKADSAERPRVNGVAHPTVKPLSLMRWLARLVTPPGGTVLDLFAGSGTTGEACALEGLRCILIEREAEYLPLIVSRFSQGVLDFGELA